VAASGGGISFGSLASTACCADVSISLEAWLEEHSCVLLAQYHCGTSVPINTHLSGDVADTTIGC
jgi:hypothetical protein